MIFVLIARTDRSALLALMTQTRFALADQRHIVQAALEEPESVLQLVKRTMLAQDLGWRR